MHSGVWSYDEDGRCEQTRRCTRAACADISYRTKHCFAEWQYVGDRKDNKCLRRRACTRALCSHSEQDHLHSDVWVNAKSYFDEFRVEGWADVIKRVAITVTAADDPCLQLEACDGCRRPSGKTRILHSWGPWQVAVNRDYDAIRVCAVDGEKEFR
jgi:hypothetical protein